LKGCILISRAIVESKIWQKPPLYIKVWLYLLVRAQHKDFNGLKRGQLYTSIPEIQNACSWYVGYRKVTPSKDKIYTVFKWLRNPCEGSYEYDTDTTMITTTKATHGMLVTIDKYSIYQEFKTYESNNETTNEKVTSNLRNQHSSYNINKNDNNDKNDNKNNIVQKQVLNESIKSIFDYYVELDLVKHKKLTDSMKKSLNKALKEYTADELKALLRRHSDICESTKNNQYPVKKRGLDIFYSQKISNNAGSPLIYEEYLEGGAKYERYIIDKYVEEKEAKPTSTVSDEARRKTEEFIKRNDVEC